MADPQSNKPDPDVEYVPYHGEAIALDAGDIVKEFVKHGLIGERYHDRQQLAQGGMGVIYKAHDVGLDRLTVLKVIHPDAVKNADLFTRFVEEARITGQLEHPNIIPVHDLGVVDGTQLYFSMKYIEGRELRQILECVRLGEPGARPYTLFHLLTIFRKVCDAVAFAHSKDIIHRDIKPDNIMVGRYGEVLLVDWGLARRLGAPEKPLPLSFAAGAFLDGHGSGTVTKTRLGIIKGTPAYMAPEMALGEVNRVDRRSDIFLLGATLYAIATLEAPFTDDGPDDMYRILQRAETGSFVLPSLRAPQRQIPEELERIILKAMATRLDDRYQNVAELSEDLDALMEGRAQSTRRHFAVGEHLMREGEEGHEAYVMLAGEVEVYKTIEGKHLSLITLGPGTTVGEMALIDDAPRSASVVAVQPTEVMVINSAIMKESLRKMPPWISQAVGSLTERLRSANQEIHPLLRTDCIYQVMSLIRYMFPFCATSVIHPETQQPILVLSAERVLLEVSTQLCISPEKVLAVLGKLLKTGLLQAFDADHFVVPNFNVFCRFLEFARRKLGQPSGVPPGQIAKLFIGPQRVAVSLTRPGEVPVEELPEIAEATEAQPEHVLRVTAEADIPRRFAALLEQLRRDPGEL